MMWGAGGSSHHTTGPRGLGGRALQRVTDTQALDMKVLSALPP